MSLYDKRPASKLCKMRKLAGHRLSQRDRNELRGHARYVTATQKFRNGKQAKLLRYHKRRKRSQWVFPDDTTLIIHDISERAWAVVA